MELALRFALGLAVLAAGFAAAAWIGWRTLRRTERPGWLVAKWIVTAVGAAVFISLGMQVATAGRKEAFIIAIGAAVVGLVLGILWAPSIGGMAAAPFAGLFDGGGQEVEARPFYAIAQARRKMGKYQEALERVREQLEKYPGDFEGLMLMAEIYGEDFKNNAAAQACVEEMVNFPKRAPKNIAYALNRAADWHLKLAEDRKAAKAALLRIPELLPETEQAQMAWQRIARLTPDRMLAEQKERPVIRMVRHEGYLGLQGMAADPRKPEENPAEAALRLVAHLNEHPFDSEAREELARVYAEHYGRVDMAADQMEELIAGPNPAPKQVARWLNMLADLQVQFGRDQAAAEAALRRIMERFPDGAAAANAEKRIAYLGLEMNRTREAKRIGGAGASGPAP